MPRQTHLRILLLLIINYSLLVNLQAQSWQFTTKLGCNTAYAYGSPNPSVTPPQLIDKLKDSKGNHYLYYYVTGDTFYFDNYTYKRYLRGGDGYALVKINCQGELQWSKIFTHDRKNRANLQKFYNSAALFFGDNENRIVVSGRGATEGTYFYIDVDTAIGDYQDYTVVYDSMGMLVKKFINKSKSQGRSIAMGYFPISHRYFHYTYIDSSATDRIFYNGKYLQYGEYFIVLDSNMNYFKISPVTLFSKPRSLIDASEPLELTSFNSHILSNCTINHKAIVLNGSAFRPNDMYIGKYAAVGKDTFRIYDFVNDQYFHTFMCYNDTGGHEWTRFCNSLQISNWIDAFVQDGHEIFLKRDDIGTWMYQGNQLNSSKSDGTYQAVVFKIDSNGNFLWKDSLAHEKSTPPNYKAFPDVNYRSELVWNHHLFSDNNSPSWVKVGNKYFQNNTPTLASATSGYTKNLIVALGKGTQRVIDTTTEGIRHTNISHVSIDAADNVWLFGSKELDGCILNNDSTPLQYGTGNDLFIAKHGQAHCYCDPLVSSYKVIDSSIEGRISVQYTGSATDSVVFLWGDGTHSVAKPSNTPLTKIYNKTISASIAAVVYNSCYRRDTFRRTIQIKCTPPNAEFVLLDSNTKNIRIKYIGTATDTVTYQWGDGNTTKLANPLNKITSYNYTTSVDSVYISAKIKSVCGDRDTFARWYVFCPKPKKSFILDTSKLNSRILSVQYTSADSLWVHWGDGMISYKPSGIKIYNSYGVYTVSIIIKSSCGRLDTSKYVLTLGTSGIENSSRDDIVISPNPAKDFIYVFSPTAVMPPATVIPNLIRNLSFTLTNLLGQSFSPPVILASTVIPANLSGTQHHEAGISLDVRSLPTGIYLLQIKDENNHLIFSNKIAIEH